MVVKAYQTDNDGADPNLPEVAGGDSYTGGKFENEDQVRKEWNQAGIGRPITQEEIDNWMQHGKQGQIRGELGSQGTSSDARSYSNDYNISKNQWGNVVNPDTGEEIGGWLDPNSGSISLDPNSSFGEGSVPLWGQQSAAMQKIQRGELLYDSQVAEDDSFDPASSTFGAGGNSIEGDWISIPVGVKVDDKRLSTVSKDDKPFTYIDKNGQERILYQKVSAKQKWGFLGHDIGKAFDKYVPGDVKNVVTNIIDTSTLGFGNQAAFGTEGKKREGKMLHGIFGGSAEDWDTAVSDVIPLVVSYAVGAYTGQWWIGPTVHSAQETGRAATLEAQDHDVDWDEVTYNVAKSWAVAGAGELGAYEGATATAGFSAYEGDDWDEIATAFAFDAVGAELDLGVAGNTALVTGESVLAGDEWNEVALKTTSSYAVGSAGEAGIKQEYAKQGLEYEPASLKNPRNRRTGKSVFNRNN